ncbi:hypothetical protein [Allopontixanthobacter sediminis]|uniref:Uncharacterized protein n=1 Tax=Allopontixanthobacter sediminis TaxID=1689985 RepID=A0A845B658_9SPHN|nr:hypothetical protein [Allopontixanthobacter sediminis]MXP44972.1 hypothetical protein [Allopontixanthobacter sediminis]
MARPHLMERSGIELQRSRLLLHLSPIAGTTFTATVATDATVTATVATDATVTVTATFATDATFTATFVTTAAIAPAASAVIVAAIASI